MADNYKFTFLAAHIRDKDCTNYQRIPLCSVRIQYICLCTSLLIWVHQSLTTLDCCTVLLSVEGPTVADVKELLRPRDVTKAEINAVEIK